MVGSNLKQFLSTGGHDVVSLVRDRRLIDDRSVFWDPAAGVLDPANLEGVDAVVHLQAAGPSLVSDRSSRVGCEELSSLVARSRP
jgi:nucleoside-diphosphate-sugar epimerase